MSALDCGCWDCRRGRGETPGLWEVPFRKAADVGERCQRVGRLFPGESAPPIPPEADVTGDDRRFA